MARELQIAALENGIVIDHIPAGKTFSIVEILKLEEYSEIITVATNLKSSSLGKKGLIKIEDKSLNKKELGEIALLATDVTINIIENLKKIKKIKLDIPNEIFGFIRCNNGKCISNHEDIESRFIKIASDKSENLKYKCYYCERTICTNEIELKAL